MARRDHHINSMRGSNGVNDPNSGSRLSKVMNWLGSAFVIALLATVASMWQSSIERSAEDGERKALLKSTTQELADSKAETRRLTEQKDQLQRDIDTLRKELLEEKSSNFYNQKMLKDAETNIAKLDAEKNSLTLLVNKNDPCEAERLQIKKIEEQLSVQPFWSHALQGTQREEAIVARDKKYEALNTCLSRR